MLHELPSGPTPPCGCSLEECSCEDNADFLTDKGLPICGCCLGDCPDVHPLQYAKLSKAMEEAIATDVAGREMASEGGRVLPEDDERVQMLRLIVED